MTADEAFVAAWLGFVGILIVTMALVAASMPRDPLTTLLAGIA